MGQHQPPKVNSRVVTYLVRTVPGREVPLAALPPLEGIILKDFTSGVERVGDFDLARVKLEVRADGRVLAELRPTVEQDASGEAVFRFGSHLTKGILVFRGERVCLRSDGPQTLLVTVGALIQGSLS